MSEKNSSDVIDSLDGRTGNRTTLLPTNQIKNIIAKLRVVIDERDKNFADAKSLILELARHLDETRQCEETQICRKIKEMLNDKINEGKITGKWIEECLPQEYKRKYTKRAAIRSINKATTIKGLGVELAEIDYAKPATLSKAFNGADKLFLNTPFQPDMVKLTSNLVAEQ